MILIIPIFTIIVMQFCLNIRQKTFNGIYSLILFSYLVWLILFNAHKKKEIALPCLLYETLIVQRIFPHESLASVLLFNNFQSYKDA